MNDPTSTRSFLDPTLAEMVDRVCDRFEAAWKAAGDDGPPPALADYLDGVDEPARSVLLRELLALELAYRRRRGERPTEAEYRERFPGHDTLIDSVWGEAAEAVTVQGPPPAAGETLPHPGPSAPAGAAAHVHVPGYEVLDELGRGGMGVVYKARHLQLKRVVALKMILHGGHAGAAELARFRAEAEAVARLQHPHIVQVYEVGEYEGKPYFSLEFCAGGGLDKRLAGTPLEPREAARLVETLAQAVQAAHQQHVVHRDLKPANVLLTAGGQPKVTDFGLARKMDEAGQTQSGAIMGTPSYMAPEQAAGKTKEIGPAADVYALGAILYECLTGRPPFKAATVMETLSQVVSEEPVPPRRLQSKTPRDLESVCLMCLRKEPGQRYASAGALADDLRRFLAGEGVRARPTPLWRRGWRRVRRMPIFWLLLLGLALVGAAKWYVVYFAQPGATETPGTETPGSDQSNPPSQTSNTGAPKRLCFGSVALSADGQTLAASPHWETQDGRQIPADFLIYLWDTATGRRKGRIDLSENLSFTDLDFSPDGSILCGYGWKQLVLWSAATGQELLQLWHQSDQHASWSFSPDSRLLAMANTDQTVRLWDIAAGKATAVLKGNSGAETLLAFSPDSRYLATNSNAQKLKIWDVATGQEQPTLLGHFQSISLGVFAPEDPLIVTRTTYHFNVNICTTRFWDSATGVERRLPLADHEGPIPYDDVFLSPDGKTVVATTHARGAGCLVAIDAGTGQEKWAYPKASASIDLIVLARAADRKALPVWFTKRTGSQKGDVNTLAFLDWATGEELVTATTPLGPRSYRCSVSADGKKLATINQGKLELWDVTTGQVELR